MGSLDALLYGVRDLFLGSTQVPQRARLRFNPAHFALVDDELNEWTAVSIDPDILGEGVAVTFAGDLSGDETTQTVEKIKHTTVGTAGGALPIGSVMRATGVSAADWGPVNLELDAARTGTLDADHGGTGLDVADFTGNAEFLLAINGTEDGYTLVDPTSVGSGGVTFAGDLSGSSSSQVVEKIHGTTVPAGGSLTPGQVLRATGVADAAWGAVNLALAAAVTGILDSNNGGTGLADAALTGNADFLLAVNGTEDGYTLVDPTSVGSGGDLRFIQVVNASSGSLNNIPTRVGADRVGLLILTGTGVTLTGLDDGEDADGGSYEIDVLFVNAGLVAHQSGSSAAENQLDLSSAGSLVEIGEGEILRFRYDSNGTERWRWVRTMAPKIMVAKSQTFSGLDDGEIEYRGEHRFYQSTGTDVHRYKDEDAGFGEDQTHKRSLSLANNGSGDLHTFTVPSGDGAITILVTCTMASTGEGGDEAGFHSHLFQLRRNDGTISDVTDIDTTPAGVSAPADITWSTDISGDVVDVHVLNESGRTVRFGSIALLQFMPSP